MGIITTIVLTRSKTRKKSSICSAEKLGMFMSALDLQWPGFYGGRDIFSSPYTLYPAPLPDVIRYV
jgi:hypothetical protein